MSEVWINDVDLADYGFVLGQNPEHAAAPDFSDATAALLGQLGPTWLNEPVQAAARRIVIGGHYTATSATQLRSYTDALKSLVSVGAVRVRFADRTDQEFRDGRLISFRPQPRAAILSTIAADLQITLEFADPVRADVNAQGISLSSSRAALPIGTAPAFPVIVVHGDGASLTNPTLTYRDAAGNSQQTMGFTGTLAAGDYLIIDCVRTRITKSVSGTQSDAISWWTSGDFLAIRPADGWPDLLEYPTLELGGTGTPVGLCTYLRRWM